MATAIQPVLESTEIKRAEHKPPESLEAWDHVMRGRSLTMHLEKEPNAQARVHFQRALDSDADYVPAHFHVAVATAHYVAGRDAEALEWALKALHERPRVPAALRLVAASHAQLGNKHDAHAAMNDVLAVSPRASLGLVKRVFHFKRSQDMQRYVDGLRKAGMPE